MIHGGNFEMVNWYWRACIHFSKQSFSTLASLPNKYYTCIVYIQWKIIHSPAILRIREGNLNFIKRVIVKLIQGSLGLLQRGGYNLDKLYIIFFSTLASDLPCHNHLFLSACILVSSVSHPFLYICSHGLYCLEMIPYFCGNLRKGSL